MKILGILLPILLSSLTIAHGKKKLGFSKGVSSDIGAEIGYYDSSCSCNLQHAPSNYEEPVVYKTVPAIVLPAASASYSAAPVGGSMSLSKKGKKGSGISYEDLLGSLGKSLAGSFDKKGKGHHGGSAPADCSEKVQSVHVVPVQIPVQQSYSKDDCYDSVPSVVPVSYKPVGPANCGSVPTGPSISYQKSYTYEPIPMRPSVSCPHNVGSVVYGGVPMGPSVSYQKHVDYEAVPIGASVSYPHNVGSVVYGGVPIGPSISYEKPGGYRAVPIGASISYQKSGGYGTVPIGAPISYPSTVGSVAYEQVPVGPVAYEPVPVGPVEYGVPVGTSVSYQSNVSPIAYGAVPVGPSLSYQKSVGSVSIGHDGNYAPQNPSIHHNHHASCSGVGSPVVAVPSGHQSSHQKIGLIASKKYKPVHYAPPPHAAPAQVPPSQGSYVIVSSGHSPHGNGCGCGCQNNRII